DAGDNRALVIATHHPVFSEGGHSGSDVMLSQIDQVCTAAGIVPHALLAGHTHTYQRYTRTINRPMAAQMICIDAGYGGHALLVGRRRMGRVVPDQKYPGMYRSTLSAGRLSDMSNLAHAKDAVMAAAERELEWEARRRSATRLSKCPGNRG